MALSPFSSPTESDENLAKLHLAGEDGAFRCLVERYAQPLFGYARRLAGNEDDANELCQETFLRLYQYLPKLSLDQPLKPWLYRVCTNLCRNLAKRKKTLSFSQLASREDEELPPLVEDVPDTESTPEEDMQRKSTIQDVRAAVEMLPKKYHLVVSLYYWDGLSYEEIADILSLPINTVRTHLRRARQHLDGTLRHLL